MTLSVPCSSPILLETDGSDASGGGARWELRKPRPVHPLQAYKVAGIVGDDLLEYMTGLAALTGFV